VWEPKTTQYLCSKLQPGQVFVDIGANAGYFTLLASRLAGASGKVLAVEPNPRMAEQVRQNVLRSGLTNVVLEQVACSNATSVRTLYLGGAYNTGSTSLCARNLRYTESIRVNCMPADTLVERHALTRLDIVKIDVEGAELDVLRGMTAILKQLRPNIIIELVPSLLEGFSATIDEVLKYLAAFDYSVSSLAEHCNYLCTPLDQRSN
jgi:FkbM family methyltransferase